MTSNGQRPLRRSYCPACGLSAGMARIRPRRDCRDIYCPRFGMRVTLAGSPGACEIADELRRRWRPIRSLLAEAEHKGAL